jgi:hypothetical protein
MTKVVNWVISPSSIEENRGSFCYNEYYLVSALRSRGEKVIFLEDFTITQKDVLDDIDVNDNVYISLWSYPQIGLCRLLHLRLGRAKFFGYSPLVVQEKLPLFVLTEDLILDGIKHYAFEAHTFKHLLLSDCDGHLKGNPEVFPLCGSYYGCKNNCSFCPVTPNLPNKTYIDIPASFAFESLKQYQELVPGSGVHFTDEDFFIDPLKARFILSENKIIQTNKPSIIALASVSTFTKFLDTFHDDEKARAFCSDVGLSLIEVGLETASVALSKKMGKPVVSKSVALAERMKGWETRILWLTLTLSPGETLSSIRETGSFLEKYGMSPSDMTARLKTNGTIGGLGQYFQIYPGTRAYHKVQEEGIMLTEAPTRLIPSFIPNSLLQDKIHVLRDWAEEDGYWLDFQGAPKFKFSEGQTVLDCIQQQEYPRYKSIMTVCIAARLGVIESKI